MSLTLSICVLLIAAKISALSSGKLDKYEYLTGEEILPSNQNLYLFLLQYSLIFYHIYY